MAATKTYLVTLNEKTHKTLAETLDQMVGLVAKHPERFFDMGVELATLKQALEDAEEVTERKPRKKADDEYVPKLCKEHPKYGARRPPRTPCEGCWDAYGSMNPMAVSAARRKFERNRAETTCGQEDL